MLRGKKYSRLLNNIKSINVFFSLLENYQNVYEESLNFKPYGENFQNIVKKTFVKICGNFFQLKFINMNRHFKLFIAVQRNKNPIIIILLEGKKLKGLCFQKAKIVQIGRELPFSTSRVSMACMWEACSVVQSFFTRKEIKCYFPQTNFQHLLCHILC